MYLGEQHCFAFLPPRVSTCVCATHPRRLLTPCSFCRSSDPQSSLTLARNDVVKIHLGAHIDGFASISAETIVVGASEQEPVTGRRADVIKAAYNAAELAMRLIKVGNKNWAVTEGVNKIVAAWDCKAVEGMPYISS